MTNTEAWWIWLLSNSTKDKYNNIEKASNHRYWGVTRGEVHL